MVHHKKVSELDPIFFFELVDKVVTDVIENEKDSTIAHGDKIKVERLLSQLLTKIPAEKVNITSMFVQTMHRFATNFPHLPNSFSKAIKY